MFQTSSSAIMNICKDLQKWSVYVLFFLREINHFLKTLSSFYIFEKALFLDTRDSILEPQCEYRVLSLEDRVSSIEKQGFLEYVKTRKGFEEMIYFLKEEQYSTAHTYSKVQATSVSRRSLSHENFRPKDSGLTVIFFLRQLVFKT